MIDADDLAGWETMSGEPAVESVPAPDDWRLHYRWVWTRNRIAHVVGEHVRAPQNLFVCGIATNQRDLLDLFDLVFLLTLDHHTQIERLDAPANAHRRVAERTQIIEGRPIFEAEMQAAGAILLDGRQPTPLLATRILSAVTSTW